MSSIQQLAECLRADANLLIWTSWPDRSPKLYYIWSNALPKGLADYGEPTLEEAIAKFHREHLKQIQSTHNPRRNADEL